MRSLSATCSESLRNSATGNESRTTPTPFPGAPVKRRYTQIPNLGCPVLAQFWLGRGKIRDRILCRPRGTRTRIVCLPTVETVGYHLSRPKRWGCVQLPSFPFREGEQNRPANCYFRNLTALSSRPILCL